MLPADEIGANIDELKELLQNPPVIQGEITLKDRKDTFTLSSFPLSDHKIFGAFTNFGSIVSLNFLNPTSPVGPGFLPADKKGRYKIINKDFHETRMKEMAAYIAKLFAAGVNILMMQEVPEKDTKYYNIFVDELKKHLKEKNVAMNWSSLKDSFRAPLRLNSEDEYHDFGCAVLVTEGYKLDSKKITSALRERAFVYPIENVAKHLELMFHNIHGDYENSEETADYIAHWVKEFAIVAADTNIPLSNTAAIATLKKIPGICLAPLQVDGKKVNDYELTLDGLYVPEGYGPVYLNPNFFAEVVDTKKQTSVSNQNMFSSQIIKKGNAPSDKNDDESSFKM